MTMKSKEIEGCVVRILEYIGDDPKRQGLIDTPRRVAQAYQDLFKGYDLKNKPKLMILDNGEDGIVYDEMIFDTGSFHSFCEHHMLQFSGRYFVGFVPNKKMIGLSKIARLVEFYSSKLQVQERLVKEIADELEGTLRPKGLGVQLMASHSCKEIRGVKNKGKMITTDLRGCFKKDQKTREEFISLITLSKGD